MAKRLMLIVFFIAGMNLFAQELTPLSESAMLAGVWEMEEDGELVWQIAVFNGGTTMNLLNFDAADPNSTRGRSFITIETEWENATQGRVLFQAPTDSEQSTINFRAMIDSSTGTRYLRVLPGSVFKPGDYRWVRARAFD